MKDNRLLPKAWVALVLGVLYSAATSLCSVFVSVYLWVNSHDFDVVCRHYLAVYIATPIVFLLAGWYSQSRDRLHPYRLGLALFAVFHGALLILRDRSPDYATWLGILLGITWGVYWAGANTFDFDMTLPGKREYFLGLLNTFSGIVNLLCPFLSGLVIRWAAAPTEGYLFVFAGAVAIYAAAFGVSFLMPPDRIRRPYRIWRALFPGKDQRDWQLTMLASASLAGSFSIFSFLLGLLVYMKTDSEISVGGYVSVQALVGVVTAFFVARTVSPRTRRTYMFWGVVTLLIAGGLMVFPLTLTTLLLFGLLRSVSSPLFGIPNSGLRLDVIQKCAETPEHRIEYLCAWEAPLAVGRVFMMAVMMLAYDQLAGSEVAVRVMLFVLCAVRIVTYQLTIRISPIRDYGGS